MFYFTVFFGWSTYIDHGTIDPLLLICYCVFSIRMSMYIYILYAFVMDFLEGRRLNIDQDYILKLGEFLYVSRGLFVLFQIIW